MADFLNKEMVDLISNPEEWHNQFSALDNLRIINKFHVDTLMFYLSQFAPFIKSGVDNLRSGISKNALMLTTELFSNKENMKDPKN